MDYRCLHRVSRPLVSFRTLAGPDASTCLQGQFSACRAAVWRDLYRQLQQRLDQTIWNKTNARVSSIVSGN